MHSCSSLGCMQGKQAGEQQETLIPDSVCTCCWYKVVSACFTLVHRGMSGRQCAKSCGGASMAQNPATYVATSCSLQIYSIDPKPAPRQEQQQQPQPPQQGPICGAAAPRQPEQQQQPQPLH